MSIYKGLTYYKYENWTQPVLSSNTDYGTLTSSITTWNDGQVWHISDGIKGTNNKWGGTSGSGNVIWHLPEKIKINSFQVYQTNETSYLNRFPKTIKLYASDDGINYVEVGSASDYSQPASADYVNVTCNTSKTYEYYKWEFGTSWKGSEIAVSEVVITAQKVTTGTSTEYDYTEIQKVNEIYIGSTKIGKIYKGSTLVYESGIPAGTIVFESSTAGTYTVNIPNTQNYYIELVGGGGGGFFLYSDKMGGGSGAYVYGSMYLEKGIYSLVIGGAGSNGKTSGSIVPTDGGDTSFNNQIARGGNSINNSFKGGTYTTTLTGVTGNDGGYFNIANSVYDNSATGYGAGGYAYSDKYAVAGYVKIVTA